VQIIDVLTLSWQNADTPVKVHGAAARVLGSQNVAAVSINVITISLIAALFICLFLSSGDLFLQGEALSQYILAGRALRLHPIIDFVPANQP
jgi:hypothetical protein